MPPWWAVVLGVLVAGVVALFWAAARAGALKRTWAQALEEADALQGPGAAQRRRRAWESGAPGSRFAVVLSLSKQPDEEALDLLEAAFADRWTDIRATAATALGEFRTEAAERLLLERGLTDRSSMVRAAAIESLGLMGSAAAIEPLAGKLRDAVRGGRWASLSRTMAGLRAAEALGKIGTPESVAVLEELKGCGSVTVQRAVEAALGVHGLLNQVAAGRATGETFEKLASIALVRRDYAEAEGWLTRALELDEANASLQHLMALVQQKLGRPQEAQTRYERAIALNPQEPFPHFGLGVILAERGYRKRAIGCFQEYLKLAPQGDQAVSAREYLASLQEA